MEMNARLALTMAGIFMFAAVALGAFGAHALRGHLDPEMTAVWQYAVQYHAWHALALLGMGSLMLHCPRSRGFRLAAWLFVAGILLFVGQPLRHRRDRRARLGRDHAAGRRGVPRRMGRLCLVGRGATCADRV